MLKTLESTERGAGRTASTNSYMPTIAQKTPIPTGNAPYFLLFGRKPRLPIYLILSPTDDGNEGHSYSKLVENWETQMSETYQKVRQNSSHRKEKDIARHELIKKLSLVL